MKRGGFGALVAVAAVLGGCGASTPADVDQAADEAWSVQGCVASERFLKPGEAGRYLPNSTRQYNVRCGADNPTGTIAVIGTYDRADLARRDARAYKRGPACETSQVVVIGFFSSFTSDRNAPQVNTAKEGIETLCARIEGTYVR